ncbi:MAG: hypothetical protein WEF50_01750 [Myxococcota bacterium]
MIESQYAPSCVKTYGDSVAAQGGFDGASGVVGAHARVPKSHTRGRSRSSPVSSEAPAP